MRFLFWPIILIAVAGNLWLLWTWTVIGLAVNVLPLAAFIYEVKRGLVVQRKSTPIADQGLPADSPASAANPAGASESLVVSAPSPRLPK